MSERAHRVLFWFVFTTQVRYTLLVVLLCFVRSKIIISLRPSVVQCFFLYICRALSIIYMNVIYIYIYILFGTLFCFFLYFFVPGVFFCWIVSHTKDRRWFVSCFFFAGNACDSDPSPPRAYSVLCVTRHGTEQASIRRVVWRRALSLSLLSLTCAACIWVEKLYNTRDMRLKQIGALAPHGTLDVGVSMLMEQGCGGGYI